MIASAGRRLWLGQYRIFTNEKILEEPQMTHGGLNIWIKPMIKHIEMCHSRIKENI